VIYDVSFPFVENWNRLQHLRSRPALSGIPFVITTSEPQELERRVGVHERAVEVNRIENAADDVHDEALRRLFEEERDAITLIKWKEVLDLMEEATDRCEDVANALESVVVKHG
jgi:hypothetical protein